MVVVRSKLITIALGSDNTVKFPLRVPPSSKGTLFKIHVTFALTGVTKLLIAAIKAAAQKSFILIVAPTDIPRTSKTIMPIFTLHCEEERGLIGGN